MDVLGILARYLKSGRIYVQFMRGRPGIRNPEDLRILQFPAGILRSAGIPAGTLVAGACVDTTRLLDELEPRRAVGEDIELRARRGGDIEPWDVRPTALAVPPARLVCGS